MADLELMARIWRDSGEVEMKGLQIMTPISNILQYMYTRSIVSYAVTFEEDGVGGSDDVGC